MFTLFSFGISQKNNIFNVFSVNVLHTEKMQMFRNYMHRTRDAFYINDRVYFPYTVVISFFRTSTPSQSNIL